MREGPRTIGQRGDQTAAGIERMRTELRFLLAAGRVGAFDHIELIEIIAMPSKGVTLNVLSVAVLAEGRPDVGATERPAPLTARITRIAGFQDWTFGVMRTLRPVAALDRALATLAATGQWTLSGQPIGTGALWPEPRLFAPPDGTIQVPLNGVLKNNFWAGSHVFRLTDQEKIPFAPFLDDRRRLQALSDAVSVGVPMAFAGLADLLGDVLIQVPVTILAPEVTAPRGAEHSEVTMTWRPGSLPRGVTVAARSQWDELLTGASISAPFQHTARLAIDGHRHPLQSEIFDIETGMLIGATSSTSTLKRIELGVHIVQHEPRLFTVPNFDNQPVAQRVTLTETRASIVGADPGQDANFWRDRRQDLEERRRLDETRDFVQYRPQANSRAEQLRALADIRFLIDTHGQTGADLWDPYLTGVDLLRTLFWCSHSGAPLRALTDGRDPPRTHTPDQPTDPELAPGLSFPDEQRAVLERYGGNGEGLRLEYRTRRGPKGWAFHDRFLIFPNGRDGPRAWSLGTSINSLGQAHHILQKVSNPVMVAGAFEDLWTALDEHQHVVWRSR